MQKRKTSEAKSKGAGARPRKPAELYEGKQAAARFASGIRHVLAGGPHPTGKTD